MRLSAGQRALLRVSGALDRVAPWYRLPRPLGLVGLLGIRIALRAHNLYDPAPPREGEPARAAGVPGRPFGRNQPLWGIAPRDPEALVTPSPRLISERLLARDGAFRPVPFLNLLAASWLQFMVHDWMSHGPGAPGEEIRVPLADGDRWAARSPDGDMLVRRSRPSHDPDAPAGAPVFDNTESAWWDGSQLYGSTPAREAQVREGDGGRLTIGMDGLLPLEGRSGVDLTGVNGNWWLGLAAMHTLFAREHNAVCAMLAGGHPDWDDDRLFAVARRITAAVMAKIHTVEWTPAIVPHPTVGKAMRSNWYGLLGPRGSRVLRRWSRADALIGIPGSRCEDHGVPYSLTEEFVAVYRMHPLLPDEMALRNGTANGAGGWTRVTMKQVTGAGARPLMESYGLAGVVASFGHVRPGMLALHNYPDTLRDLERPSSHGSERRIDLAAVDVIRDRERGVPRYNAFRRMLRMRPVRSFEELTGGDAAAAAELRDVYGDVEQVDLMVGCYAEPLLPGFGFSETAFRIFVLMASRRLKSDPRYTDEWGPEHYTPEGLRWIEDATMAGVIRRHLPELGATLDALPGSPFAPWGPEPSFN
ncbi:MAG: peroxidase family protein [Thermoleophilia bacterium]